MEDLASLLHFIRLEPWGNWSFFKTFITLPFQQKDPKAIEIIQVVLENIRALSLHLTSTKSLLYLPTVLRREKSMKDKDGKPIVSLPKKHISSVELDFSPEEQFLYDALYKRAKSRFLDLSARGAVSKYEPFTRGQRYNRI